ncbi:hypothetical protein CAQU_01805 [Corynebacterium aquilae DSM 44791]|uniref:Propionate 3-nitronate monooxygenase n=1 Tax=Corynebacterium aquilae DSM 44791 TaxID=1431546 RepID=A0A1L7CE05_9CORY|nr:hypothetical protein CAQU_01805 [Corynebacterium aquilae DSM 44791]
MDGVFPLGARLPIVQAPMAGGPACPALAAAVSNAGGLGSLAGGYKTAAALGDEIAEVEELTDYAYGINLFVPAQLAQGAQQGPGDELNPRHTLVPAALRQEAFDSFRSRIKDCCEEELPSEMYTGDDDYPAKLELALASHAACISFTFGIPPAGDIARVKEAGKQVVLNAISPAGIDAAIAAGADVLVVQCAQAGGHRAANAHVEDDTAEYTLGELLACARAKTTIPVIAAGGVSGAEDVVELLTLGATAVQVGTLFLLAEEAGTKEVHRQALVEFRQRPTGRTRAFSGRMARGITNGFMERFGEDAPALYPELHYLTAPIKAQGDPETASLWAGTGFANCVEQPAGTIVRGLVGL